MKRDLDKEFDVPIYYLCTVFNYTARKLTSFYNEILKPLGITATQMIAIGELFREDGISLGEFADRVRVVKSAAVIMINRLEKMGYVEKSKNHTDKRLNVLHLTEKGLELIPLIAERASMLENEIVKAIGPSDFAKFVEGLSIMRDFDLSSILEHFREKE